MNKLLKTTVIVLLIISLSLAVAIFQPWQYISFLPIVNSGTALTVNTPLGKAEIYLDGKKVGETPYSSENLSPGDYDLEIRRISAEPDFYEAVTKRIHLEANTRTFVETEIGPGKQFSSLQLIYYRKSPTQQPSIYIDTVPKESTIKIDDLPYGTAPVTSDELSPGKHTVSISRVGYEDLETVVISREGYTLIAEIQLMAQPIEIDQP